MNRQRKRDNLVVSVSDLEREGTRNLPKHIGQYYNEGSMDLLTLNDNKAAFDRYRIRPRVGRDVSQLTAGTKLWGSYTSLPVGFSPTAMHGMAHAEGERATSRAAACVGVPMILSHYSNTSIEDVVRAGEGKVPYAMQLCAVNDWETNVAILRRAEKAGCRAFILTCDTPSLGRRLNEHRNNFTLPDGLAFPNMPDDVDMHNMIQDDPRVTYDKAFGWDKIKRFIALSKIDVFLKGILTAEDALLALDTGAKGIIVSTHGGRQLDGAVSALDALPGVVEAVGGRMQVHLDSGIRRGSDIFKALALGADFCWVGRLAIWGLAYKGQEGAELGLQLLEDELVTTMSLSGCASLKDIRREHLGRLNADGEFVPLKPRAELLHTLDYSTSNGINGANALP